MSTVKDVSNPSPTLKLTLKNINFPELPLFLIFSLIFLDIGIIFGSMNSFRVAGEEFFGSPVKLEIHQTHWTSTLLGGVTLIMMGQIYSFMSQLSSKEYKLHWLSLIVLGSWVFGSLASYATVWVDYETWIDWVKFSFQFGAWVFVMSIAAYFTDSQFRSNLKKSTPMLHMLSAVAWLWIAVIFFFDIPSTRAQSSQTLDRMFLFTYIYGFFSLALFGSLSLVLPILFNQKARSNKTNNYNLILLNAAAIVILSDLYLSREKDIEIIAFDIIGPFLWGLAGFLFILYVFDIVYKTGFQSSLIALLVALMMFGFFVFDTLMKNIFPKWVSQSHFHFLFIGTLLITIISIGSRLLIIQYSSIDPEENVDTKIKYSQVRLVGIITTIVSVGGILLSFTLSEIIDGTFVWAGYFGLSLFVGLVLVELVMILNLFSSLRNEK